MTRVEIDLNSRNADGFTPARLRNVHGDAAVGQVVTAFESEDGVKALAMVMGKDDRYVYLLVNWGSIGDDDGLEATLPYGMSASANRAQASVQNIRASRSVQNPPVRRAHAHSSSRLDWDPRSSSGRYARSS